MSGTLVVGDFAITPTGLPSQSLMDSTRWLSASIPRDEVDGIIESEGLVVVLLSDGAYNAWMEDCPCLDEGWGGDVGANGPCKVPWHRSSVGGDPDIYLQVPAEALASAKATAGSVIGRARQSGLHDNTTIAVARIPQFNKVCV